MRGYFCIASSVISLIASLENYTISLFKTQTLGSFQMTSATCCLPSLPFPCLYYCLASPFAHLPAPMASDQLMNCQALFISNESTYCYQLPCKHYSMWLLHHVWLCISLAMDEGHGTVRMALSAHLVFMKLWVQPLPYVSHPGWCMLVSTST